MSKLDLTKPVQRRDGTPVRIICTDRKSVAGYVMVVLSLKNNEEHEHSYTIDGCFYNYKSSELDLINVPVKHTYWINMYPNGKVGVPHSSKEEADRGAGIARIACLKLIFEEGEGLDTK